MPTVPSRRTRFYRHKGNATPAGAPYAGQFMNTCLVCRERECPVEPVAIRFAPHGDGLQPSAQIAFTGECGAFYAIVFGTHSGGGGYVFWTTEVDWAQPAVPPDPIRFLGSAAATLDPDDVDRFVGACYEVLGDPGNATGRPRSGYVEVDPDGFRAPILIPSLTEPVLTPEDQDRLVEADRVVIGRCQVVLPLPLEPV